MPASLSFKKNATEETANLSEVKVITLTDGNGNEYTLDSTNGLKLKYKPTGGTTAVEEVNSLDSFIRALFNRKADDGMTDGTRKMTILEEEVADKDIVKAIFNAKEQPSDTQSILATKVADKDVVKAIFSAKEQPADTQSILATKVADKGVAGAILNAQDGQKSVLVETLGGFLDKTDAVYGNSDPKKVAKDFLAEKGLKPTPAELAGDSTFANAVAIEVNSNNPGFQGSVREVIDFFQNSSKSSKL